MIDKIIYVGSSKGCAACKTLLPKFNDTVKNLNIDVPIEYVDTYDDDGMMRADELRVRNIPTVIFMDCYNEIGREVGSLAYMEIHKYFMEDR